MKSSALKSWKFSLVVFCSAAHLLIASGYSRAATKSHDKIRGTYMDLTIRADLNRDGEIDFTKEDASQGEYTDRSSPNRPYRFWINNDYDVVNSKGDVKENLTTCGSYLNPDAVSGDQYRQACEQWDEDPDKSNNTDSTSRLKRIEAYRDLEDFAPLAISLGTNNIAKDLYLKLTAEGVYINMFKGIWKEGEKAHSYIYDASKTEEQVRAANEYLGYIGQLNPSNPITLDARSVYRLFDKKGIGRFIFEGVDASADECNQGKRECYISIELYRKNTKTGKGADTLLLEDKLYINLYDVDDLFESITAGDASQGEWGDYDAVYFGSDAIQKTNSIKVSLYQDIENEAALDKYYILLVHGWRMTEPEKRSFAQTSFKRLYWSGYRGRFGAFNWPTGWFNRAAHIYTDTGAINTVYQITEIMNNKQHYDRSESVARRVGRDLIQRLHDGILRTANEYHVFAHSMGNVVVSEAIRHDNSADPFFTSYSPSEAATVAGAYKQDQRVIEHILFGISEWGCSDDVPLSSEDAWRCYNNDDTGMYDMPPDLYRFDMAEEDGGALVIRHGPTTEAAMNALVGSGKKSYYDELAKHLKQKRIINYYNRRDAALKAWEFNQLTKPDVPDDFEYATIPFAGDRVTSRFTDADENRQLQWSEQLTEDSANILARIIPARTNALGQSNIDDESIGIASQDLKFTDSNQDHSGQFHGYYSEPSPYSGNDRAVRAVYWNSLLKMSIQLPSEDYSGLKNGLGVQ
jgi:hypothetical protein